MIKKYITKQSNIKGAGKGLFTKDFFKKGEVIGLAHVDDQPASEIGRNHNHNEENPTAYSKKINNKRFIYASKDLNPGEEITTNYRMQPELEQPEDFMRKGGSVLKMPNKKNSKGYSRSLSATNKLFTQNFLFEKPKSRKNKVFDPNSKYYAEGGESKQKIIFSPKEGGCPEGQYWTGTECKIIPKNTKIVYSEEELAKTNISKKEQEKLYNQYISRVNNHAIIYANRERVYGNIRSKDKYYKTLESIPNYGFSPMISYGNGQLISNGLGPGIPSLVESMVDLNQWKKMMNKSSVKPIGYKGHPGGGHFYPVYEKPSNYLLGYNKEEEPIKKEEILNLALLKPTLLQQQNYQLQGNNLNEKELKLPNEEVESEYLEPGSPDTENAMEWVNKRKYNIDWDGLQIPFRLPRFRKSGSYGPLIKKGKQRYINLPTIESRNTAYLKEKKEGGALLTKKVTCKKCGWEWDAEDGGKDITTCHKCGGQGLIHAQKGGDKDAMTGMMKARLAYTNEFGNPAAKRMINIPDNPYQFDNGDIGTHYMASYDNYAVPQIQDENGVLQLGDYGPESNETIRFDSDEDANYFAENYKDVSPGFIEADLNEDEIEEYRRGGYIVEEIDNYQKGGISKVSSNSSDNTRVNYQKPLVKSFNRSNNLESFYKKEREKDLQKQKDATAYHNKTQKVKQNQSLGEFINQNVLGIPTYKEQEKQLANDKKLLKKELKPYFKTEKEIDQFISQQYSRPTASAENNWNDGSIQMVYPEKYFIGPSGGIIGNIKNLGKNTFNLGKKVLSNPYVSGGLNAYFGTEGIKEFADPNSLTRKSISRAYDDPTGSNIGDAAFDVGMNSLNFVGLPFNKAIKGSKNLINNTYKINPWAFKPNPEAYYRMIGKEGYADALESGVIRPPQTMRIFDQGAQEYKNIPIPAHEEAYYNAQYPLDRKWYPNSLEKTNPKRAAIARKSGYQGPYMAEVTGDAHLFEKGENVAAYTGPNNFQTVTFSKEHIPINNPNLKLYKEHWLQGYKEVPKQLPSSPNVDFSKYLTQEEAIAARAERLISQKNKPGWNEQLTPELEQRLSTAVERHNPASDYPGEKLGSNTMGRTATEVSKNANLSGIPLNEANKARVAAHETGHYYSNSPAEGAEWLKPFNLNKLESYKTKTYLRGKNRSANYANEIRERAAQLKDYIAQKNGIPLNQDFKITQVQLDDAIKNYVKDTGLDNTMSKMLGVLKDKKGLLKIMNKYALGTVPVMIGAETLQQKKQGGISDNYVELDLTPEEIKDLIAQGYVIEELN